MTTLLVIAAACLALYAVALLALVVAGRRSAAADLVRFVPDCARLISRLARDPATPRRTKIVLVVTGGYLAFPLDLVPDFIPVAGQLDDVLVVALALRFVARSAGTLAIERHWTGSPAGLRVVLRAADLAASSTDPPG